MTEFILALIYGLVAASILGLRRRDLWPMFVNLLLIAGGTAVSLWMYANPQEVQMLRDQVQSFMSDAGSDLLILLACQPLVFFGARWLEKRLPGGSKRNPKIENGA